MNAHFGAGPRIVIIGGGIAGLSAAHALERARASSPSRWHWELFEGSNRLGGHVRTERVDGGFVLDTGPDGFIANKPEALELARAVGLGDRIVEPGPLARRVDVVHRGRLVALPDGIMLIAPTRIAPIVRTPLLSWFGKARMALDLVLPRRPRGPDESMHAFVARRLGHEAADLFAGTLLSGIHSGDPHLLSIEATFPQLVSMEQEYGSLIRGALAMRARVRSSGGKSPTSPFRSFRGGVDEIVTATERALPARAIHRNTSIHAIRPLASGRFRIELTSGTRDADAVVLACPPDVSARLLREVEPTAAATLGDIRFQSTVTVFLGFRRGDVAHPLDASGFLVPTRAGLRVNGVTYLSSKWPGRAPDDSVLIRVAMGGARDPGAVSRSDEQLVADAVSDLRPLLGIRDRPTLQAVYRHAHAGPQMEVGHTQRMMAVCTSLEPRGIFLAGSGYRGVGVPDCVRQGSDAAHQALARIESQPIAWEAYGDPIGTA